MSQEDLLRRFCEEGLERLRRLATQILSLESREDPAQIHAEIMRELHSLKGSSRMLGLQDVGGLLHQLEDVYATLHQRRQRPGPELVDLLLKANDRLLDALTALLGELPYESFAPLLGELQAMHQTLLGNPDDLIAYLAPHAPALFQVLSRQQRELLGLQYHRFRHLYEIHLSLNRSTFLADMESIHEILAEEGVLVSTTGSRLEPAPGCDLSFSFLHLSSTNADAIRIRLSPYPVGIRELPPYGSGAVPASAPAEEVTVNAVATGVATEQSKALDSLLQQLEFDEEFRELQQWFLDEGEENLRRLSRDITALEQDATGERINSIFRSFHNLKGSGGSYRFPHISRFAHHLESFAEVLRKDPGRVTTGAIDGMLKGVDLMEFIFEQCKAGRHDEIPIARLEQDLATALHHGGGPAVSPQTSATPAPSGAPLPPQTRAPEHIRIAAATVDRIVTAAVESSIAHHAEEAGIRTLQQLLQRMTEEETGWRHFEQELAEHPPALPPAGLQRLEQHGTAWGEIVDVLRGFLQEYEDNYAYRSMLAHRLRDEVLAVQLIPLVTLFESFPRIVRDTANAVGKKVVLATEGEEVSVDRRIIEALKDPLIHLLRNAVDHGIESPSTRTAAGKQETGTIRIRAESHGYFFSLSVSDDGGGLDTQRIGGLAVERGLLTSDALSTLTEEQIHQFIFRPGFTTRREVTGISGRGVGMDVVISNLKKFGGEISIDSRTGLGTSFRLVLPCSLALSNVLLIRIGDSLFSLPTGSVERIIPIERGNLVFSHGKSTLAYEGSFVPIIVLEQHLDIPVEGRGQRHGILIRRGTTLLCLSVPRVIGEQELMTKPLPLHLRHSPLFSGANVLPDGSISLLINPSSIREFTGASDANPAPAESSRRRSLLVVDDSLITRELLKNIMCTAGYDVATARDGREALLQLTHQPADLVVSDVEMPEMDGIELTRRIRANPDLRNIPVVIVSARHEEDQQRRGREAGADAYIIKGTFTQENLLNTVEQLLERAA